MYHLDEPALIAQWRSTSQINALKFVVYLFDCLSAPKMTNRIMILGAIDKFWWLDISDI